MLVNITTNKLETLLSVVRASSPREGKKADLVREGAFDLSLTWMWCTDLAKSAEHVDVRARTRGVRLLAQETLRELAPLIIASAERGDSLLRVWANSARKHLGTNPQLPKLRIVPEPPLRHLDGRPL
jgi:hypothetical protein